MMSCCQLTYEKYINADGTIDEVALTECLEKYYPDPKEQAHIRAHLCECECHIKDMKVLH